jgi:hypothetical protein
MAQREETLSVFRLASVASAEQAHSGARYPADALVRELVSDYRCPRRPPQAQVRRATSDRSETGPVLASEKNSFSEGSRATLRAALPPHAPRSILQRRAPSNAGPAMENDVHRACRSIVGAAATILMLNLDGISTSGVPDIAAVRLRASLPPTTSRTRYNAVSSLLVWRARRVTGGIALRAFRGAHTGSECL